jgi:RNA polymerase sigma-70 factor (ECF subfamily)
MQTIALETADAARPSANDHAPLYDAMLQHKSALLRVAYSILHQTEDAEDAVQAAYLSAWKAWASFRGQSSLKTWLTTIVMNKALTELQTRRRRTWMSMDGDPALLAEAEWHISRGQITQEQQAIRQQAIRSVRRQIATLPSVTKSMVLLRYVGDQSIAEIASSNGTTHDAVKGHIRRGCQTLRKATRKTPNHKQV